MFQDVKKASDTVRRNSADKYKMVLLLDNSPIHCKKADDCLNAKAMNVNSGGKQPLMRNGFYFQDDQRVRFWDCYIVLLILQYDYIAISGDNGMPIKEKSS